MSYRQLQLRSGKAVAKAWRDDAFRAWLIEDPKAALQSLGFELPEGMTVKVLEDTEHTKHVVSRADAEVLH